MPFTILHRGGRGRSPRRSARLGTGLLAALVLSAPLAGSPAAAAPAGTAADSAATRSTAEPIYTFLSAPDLSNGDLGDLRKLSTWRPGMPNSWSPSWAANVRHVYSHLASFGADDVLMAGDAVNGHWGRDPSGSGVFGRVSTQRQQRAAVKRAGTFYYREWRSFFSDNGISMDNVHPAVGDHEIGDNPWPRGTFKLAGVGAFKRVWAANFTSPDGRRKYASRPVGTPFANTSYATYLHPKVLLVTLDVFDATKQGMRHDVTSGHLTWLRKVLGAAPSDATIIVQGHNPALSPVEIRGSSGLMIDGGANSNLWKALRDYDVDFYFAGEVHANTMTQTSPGEPVQLAHGGVMAGGRTKFAIGKVYADGTVDLETRSMEPISRSGWIWQTKRRLPDNVRLRDSVPTGHAVIRDGRITERSGDLLPYGS
ncbi:metallophosphoesterase [Nocardioides pacificus]